METAFERLLKYPFDEDRKGEVDEEIFIRELKSTLQSEALCELMLEKAASGRKHHNPKNSHLGYVMGITDEKPVGLPEMYFDQDLPDIDIDFSDQQRSQVFKYIEQKYGREYVARLGTVAMFQPRSALQEVGTGLGIPKWKCDAVAESLIERSSGDSRALNTLEDTLASMPAGKRLLADHPEVEVVGKFEGHPRHYGQHAAGVVISREPISKFVAVDHRTNATMCDKKDAEDGYNLLKIDALGLTQLSVFEDALKLAGLPLNTLEQLPLDDEAAFQVLNDAKWSGIFQFNGQALQSITKQFQVDKFDDIVSVTALGRPGPLASGGAHEWIKRRNGLNPITYPHPVFEPYLKDTLGIVIYQEQVMEIGRNIGDLSWEQVTLLRKAMSKSLGKEYFDQFGDPWKAGAIAKGVAPEATVKIWDDLCLSGETVLVNPHPSKGNYRKITLKQLYERGGLGPSDKQRPDGKRKRQKLLMWDGESLKPFENWGVTYSGVKKTFTVLTESGNKIRATEDHRFLRPDGSYSCLREMKVGDELVSDAGPIPTARKAPKGSGSGGHNWWHKLARGRPSYEEGKRWLRANYKKCQHCNEAPYEETHHIDMDHENHHIKNLMAVCRRCHKKLHAAFEGYPKSWRKGRGVFNDPIVSIEEFGEEDVYDIHMPAPHHNFLADGIVVHNCAYGAWSFNKSHSVAYGLISYWCCWLKAHHPFEFAAATLSHENDPMRQIQLLREMKAEGYDYVPVDAELSDRKWAVGERNGQRYLVGPLHNVKGIGPKMVQQIIGARNRGEPLPDRARKLLSKPVTDIDSLWPVRDAVERLCPDPSAINIISKPTPIIEAQPSPHEQEFLFFCVIAKINPRDENEVVIVARRGYEIKDGKTTSLNLQLQDDTDTLFGKISRFSYERLGRPIVDRGGPGKYVYAIKGTMRADAGFRMVMIKNVRFIGELSK